MREYGASEQITILMGGESGADWADIAARVGGSVADVERAYADLRADALRLKVALLRRRVAAEVGAEKYRAPDARRSLRFYDKDAGDRFIDADLVAAVPEDPR
ncbi:hypothetical protein AB0M43_04795 [Longispora sp. NPDC051575]|uniref:hypothetical protein n=1 Tax=Longispora sp. NPDC051575 TaxID=3154943 RepID=UPI00341EF222